MLDIYIRCCIHCILYIFRVDPFTKKDWYDVKAPCMFVVRQIGKTLVTRTQGTSKYLKWKSNSAYYKTCDIARWLQCDLNTAIMVFWIKFNLLQITLKREGKLNKEETLFFKVLIIMCVSKSKMATTARFTRT